MKNAICERAIATLMNLITRLMEHRKNHKWKDKLSSLVSNYNGRYHSSIGTSPNLANKEENHEAVWQKLYSSYLRESKKKGKYSLGDRIRISINRKLFSKGYSKKFSSEIFTISKINNSNPPTYEIQDEKGEDIKGKI